MMSIADWNRRAKTRKRRPKTIEERAIYKKRKLTEIHRKKIGDSQRGKKRGLMSEQARINISLGHQKIEIYDWKGFRTELNRLIATSQKYRDWRKEVLVRDNFTCQDCGQYGENLNVHHIIRFFELKQRFGIDSLAKAMNNEMLWLTQNGITLCTECHENRHKTKPRLYSPGSCSGILSEGT